MRITISKENYLKAIAELKDAIAHDPNNPSLRRLLALSYRQKVDVLKRVGNAG